MQALGGNLSPDEQRRILEAIWAAEKAKARPAPALDELRNALVGLEILGWLEAQAGPSRGWCHRLPDDLQRWSLGRPEPQRIDTAPLALCGFRKF